MTTEAQRAANAVYMKDWTRRNRTRLLAERREKYQMNQGVRDVMRGRSRMEKLRKRGGVDLDTEDYVWTLLHDPCSYCGAGAHNPGKITAGTSTLDHVDPAGDSHWSNLTGACTSCNATKGGLPVLSYLLEQALRRDLTPIAEQMFLIRGRSASRRRIDF